MRIRWPFFAALDGQEMALRGPWAMAAPDGLVGGVPLSKPDRGASRRRSAAGGRLANAVLAHLPLAIAVIDADSRLLFWNQQAAAPVRCPAADGRGCAAFGGHTGGRRRPHPAAAGPDRCLRRDPHRGRGPGGAGGLVANLPGAGPPDHGPGAGDRIASMDVGDRRRDDGGGPREGWGGARRAMPGSIP